MGFSLVAVGRGFLHCGAGLLSAVASLVAVLGLGSTGSVVVLHGFSCSVACGIFPDQELNPFPLHCMVDS